VLQLKVDLVCDVTAAFCMNTVPYVMVGILTAVEHRLTSWPTFEIDVRTAHSYSMMHVGL